MPIKITYTATRPSYDIAFSDDDFWGLSEIVSHMENTYETTGKLLSTSFDDSDKLVHIWIEYWNTMESLEEFLADTLLNQGMASRDQYRKENNIKTTYVTEDVSIDSVPVGVFQSKHIS
jgi:hypothetical protein